VKSYINLQSFSAVALSDTQQDILSLVMRVVYCERSTNGLILTLATLLNCMPRLHSKMPRTNAKKTLQIKKQLHQAHRKSCFEALITFLVDELTGS